MRSFIVAASLLTVSLAVPPAHADEMHVRIPKPTVAIAAAVGQTYVADDRDASTLSLQGRLSFGRIEFAAELAKSEYDDEQRIDRRLGGSVYLHLSKGTLRPIISVGGGLLQADHADGLVWDMAYGQVGAGLVRRMSDKVDISVEGIVGKRKILRSNDVVLPVAYYRYWPEEEKFAELQLKLIIRL